MTGSGCRNDDPGTALVVATSNDGKLREIRGILSGLQLRVAAIGEVAEVSEPEESGSTFAENARAKALYYAHATRALVVAEDSGLEIDALDGAPGVYSARFGSPEARTYPERFALIYRLLRERVGEVKSPARFVCRLALARGEAVLFEAEGTIEGSIVEPPRGTGGFGYDPIFFYTPFEQTLAEIPAERKAEISHRGRAFRMLRAYLEPRPGASPQP